MTNNNEELNEELKDNVTYKLSQALTPEGAEVPDIADQTIEEKGHVNRFTWNDYLQAESENLKRRTEIKAQIEHDEGVKQNIELHHPFVKELTPLQIHTIAMYKLTLDQIEKYTAKHDEFVQADKRDSERKEEILKQIPELAEVKLPEVKTNTKNEEK